jgi:RNA polymerase sigma-70 factor (ECF subfamily)
MEELDPGIIKAAAKGDRTAFKALFDHYSPMVWKVVFKTAGGEMDVAQEVMQEVFVKVHRSLKGFKQASAFSTWLYRIAFTTAMTLLARKSRHRSRHVVLDDQHPGHGRSSAVALEQRDTVQRILTTLTPDERFLLIAREIDDLSYDELAQVTGHSSGALRTRISRIKENIRQGFNYEFA